MLSFLLALLIVAVAVLGVSYAQVQEALQDKTRALESERQSSYYQRIALAEREWLANNLSRVEQLLDACPADLRGWEWHYLKRLRLGSIPPLRHSGTVLSAEFSPDGRWFASGSQDGIVHIWDAATSQERLEFQAHKVHVPTGGASPPPAGMGRPRSGTSILNAQQLSPLRCRR